MSFAEHTATWITPAPRSSGVEVVWARPGSEFTAVLDIRRRVFGDEQNLLEGGVHDQDDWRSLHALALLPSAAGWQPVGIGRLTLNLGENGEALIAWVAALPNARRQGVGGAVMRFLLGAADAAGAPLVMLAAQAHAEPFYRRLGFIAADASYIVNGVTHRWMARYPPRESTTRR